MENVPSQTDDIDNIDEGGADDIVSSGSRSDGSENNTGINPLVTGFNRLSILRQVALLVGVAASVAIGLSIVMWAQETPMRPLITNLDDFNAQEIITVLQDEGVDFQIDPMTGILMVKETDLSDARLALAGKIIADDTSIGLELLDQDQSLGTSQFIENARYRRGLEGELARTISSLNAVRNARVHLAIPKQSVFVRDYREPRASVFLEIYSGKALDKDAADAIINLVASSISELNSENVTLVDQRGNLLSKDDTNQEDLLATRQFEYARKVEDALAQNINKILEPIIGTDKFRAEVSADIDFTKIEQTEELYNPDLIALRSEQALSEETVQKQDGGIPGALSNQPPGAAEVPEQVDPETGEPLPPPINKRNETTRNYEVDKTMAYTQQQQGRIRRVTVAVAVDDIEQVNAATDETTFKPWSEEELKRLELLVKDAVGFDAARGDSVSVINTPFTGGTMELGEPPFWTQPWFWEIMKQVLAGVFILVLIFGLIRPAIRNLLERGKEIEELDQEPDELEGAEELFGEDRVTLSGSDEFTLPGASEGFERQLEALRALIAEDPGRVAIVVKRWINESDS